MSWGWCREGERRYRGGRELVWGLMLWDAASPLEGGCATVVDDLLQWQALYRAWPVQLRGHRTDLVRTVALWGIPDRRPCAPHAWHGTNDESTHGLVTAPEEIHIPVGERIMPEQNQPSQFIDQIVERTLRSLSNNPEFDEHILKKLEGLASSSQLTDFRKVMAAISPEKEAIS